MTKLPLSFFPMSLFGEHVNFVENMYTSLFLHSLIGRKNHVHQYMSQRKQNFVCDNCRRLWNFWCKGLCYWAALITKGGSRCLRRPSPPPPKKKSGMGEKKKEQENGEDRKKGKMTPLVWNPGFTTANNNSFHNNVHSHITLMTLMPQYHAALLQLCTQVVGSRWNVMLTWCQTL